MKIVLDTNILISALIRDSITRKILLTSEATFYYPKEAFHEVRKYKSLILEKSKMDEDSYDKLINQFLQAIILIPEESYKRHLEKAKDLLNHVDPNDVIFLATALSLINSIIWSDDKHFDQQKAVINIKTAEMIG